MLRHSSLDVVKKHVNLYGTDLQSGVERFNPLDRLSEEKVPIRTDKCKDKR